MPKLPRGMFLRKGRGYYTRRWTDGNDRWLALGPDFDEACRKLRNAERSEVPVIIPDRKSTRLNSSHILLYDRPPTEIYSLSLHDALPIWNDRWLALGPDFDEACRKLRNAERSEVPVII